MFTRHFINTIYCVCSDVDPTFTETSWITQATFCGVIFVLSENIDRILENEFCYLWDVSMPAQIAEVRKLGESYTFGLEVVNAHLKGGGQAGNIPPSNKSSLDSTRLNTFQSVFTLLGKVCGDDVKTTTTKNLSANYVDEANYVD